MKKISRLEQNFKGIKRKKIDINGSIFAEILMNQLITTKIFYLWDSKNYFDIEAHLNPRLNTSSTLHLQRINGYLGLNQVQDHKYSNIQNIVKGCIILLLVVVVLLLLMLLLLLLKVSNKFILIMLVWTLNNLSKIIKDWQHTA